MSASAVEAALSSPEIARALRDAFGAGAAVEDVAVMTGGRSGATLLSLTVAGEAYVLRRGDPTRPAHAIRMAREIRCTSLASDRGVAPKLRHVDAEGGVTIVARVAVAPCARRTECVARTMRRLHEGPAFPTGKGTTGVAMVRLADEMLRERGGAGLPEDLVATMDEVERATLRYAETAPCHNDLNPGNILSTRDAVYLVDWETAGQSDPFFDLGQLGVFMFPSPGARAELLEAYVGRAPSEEERDRAAVARVMALGFYAAAFLHTLGGVGWGSATPVSILDLLGLLATDRASPEVAAVSLLAEMRRERTGEAYRVSKERLARG